MVKALDRLLGSAVDIPVAWLAQKKAKIDAQTESYQLVEASIAQATALEAADPETGPVFHAHFTIPVRILSGGCANI